MCRRAGLRRGREGWGQALGALGGGAVGHPYDQGEAAGDLPAAADPVFKGDREVQERGADDDRVAQVPGKPKLALVDSGMREAATARWSIQRVLTGQVAISL